MELKNVEIDLLNQLKDVCASFNDADYGKKLEVLSGSSIGAHIRHCIEFVDCMLNGFDNGLVCYDSRKHELRLENDTAYAITRIESLNERLAAIENNEEVSLDVCYHTSDVSCNMTTNVYREIVYNIEHIVHHMALIKVGIRENYKHLSIPHGFGVAQSTIKHNAQKINV